MVPYEKLGLLKVLFLHLKIRQYEDWGQFFIYNQRAGYNGNGTYHGEFRCRTKYHGLINLIEDDALWRLMQQVQFGEDRVLRNGLHLMYEGIYDRANCSKAACEEDVVGPVVV